MAPLNQQGLFLLKVICGSVAAVAGIVAAWFELRDRGQTDEQRLRTRTRYGRAWQGIQDTGILQMPESNIRRLLDAKRRAVDSILKAYDTIPTGVLTGMILTSPLLAFLAVWLRLNLAIALALAIPVGAFSILIRSRDLGILRSRRTSRITSFLDSNAFRVLAFSLLSGTWVAVGFIWLRFLLTKGLLVAVFGILVSVPLYLVYLPFAFSIVSFVLEDMRAARRIKRLPDEDEMTLVGVAVAVSFAVTLVALLAGHFAARDAPVPQTVQMVMSNVVCDGITVFATLRILAWAVRSSGGREFPSR